METADREQRHRGRLQRKEAVVDAPMTEVRHIKQPFHVRMRAQQGIDL